MKILFTLILWAVLEFIKEVGWAVFDGLSVYILADFLCFAVRYKAEFHFSRGFLLLGGLLLTLLIAHKFPDWLGKIKHL